MTQSDTWRLQQYSPIWETWTPHALASNPGLAAFALANPRTNASSRVVPHAPSGTDQLVAQTLTGYAALPTTLPAVSGILWNNGGVLQIS